VRVFLCCGIEARFGFPLELVAGNFSAYFLLRSRCCLFFFILVVADWALKWLGCISYNDFIFFKEVFC
jgi:hypothetical protein